jgi:hypothetical protein
MVVQWPDTQSFYGLSYDLLIEHLWCLGFELKKPPIEFWQWLSLLLNARKEVFFSIELHLEPLKVEVRFRNLHGFWPASPTGRVGSGETRGHGSARSHSDDVRLDGDTRHRRQLRRRLRRQWDTRGHGLARSHGDNVRLDDDAR